MWLIVEGAIIELISFNNIALNKYHNTEIIIIMVIKILYKSLNIKG